MLYTMSELGYARSRRTTIRRHHRLVRAPSSLTVDHPDRAAVPAVGRCRHVTVGSMQIGRLSAEPLGMIYRLSCCDQDRFYDGCDRIAVGRRMHWWLAGHRTHDQREAEDERVHISDRLRHPTGDTIRCVRARKMVETAVVPERGHGVGNGVDFAVSVRPSGKVEVNCSVLIGTP